MDNCATRKAVWPIEKLLIIDMVETYVNLNKAPLRGLL